MICFKCTVGGLANKTQDYSMAAWYHANCDAPDCYCQHRTGELIKNPMLGIRARA